jgi:ubiquinone/menaquinone biosynthesis C-methylase UbiE
VEIGVGSGLFAEPLNIKIGIDPSDAMLKLASERGITVYKGVAEDLPFKENSFDFALMVTSICFVTDINRSFNEIYRILKPEGFIIIGFVDKISPLGRKYQKFKDNSIFYKNATFYSFNHIEKLLEKSSFKVDEVIQTVFGEIKNVSEIQPFKEGSGDGGFTVIKAGLL